MTKQTFSEHVIDVIQERRTIKRFKSDSIPVDTIKELLDVAVWAPNHKMREPWRFLLFAGEGRKKLAKAIAADIGKDNKFESGILHNPIQLLVVLEEDPRQAVWDEDFAAVSALVQNFMLAAWSKGIGTFWVTKPFLYSPKFREHLGIQPGEKVIGMIYAGYPDVIPESRPRTPAADKLTLFDK
ncbi:MULTISPECIES: nitroreductase family protein [Paenibacillus]|uniref:Putative NAD(P)H nitroreductase n=1 Tax=Paenibacillus polymyxa TaxID=1406 RepID=A0AAP3ZU10_PAEPO|nr:nitroreductase [Paenibacillus polymyxa]AHC19567.1 nitroreductase [Paenibacillus polymyxa CR1]MDH2329547.1 nitroreductase [Paenibacillus polymyxa]